jgi:hypothetical protein
MADARWHLDEDAREAEWADLRARVAQIRAAGSEAVPLADAIELLHNEDAPAAVRRSVLGRRDLPKGEVAYARTAKDVGVRAYAVGRADTSVPALVAASFDEAWQVRVEVAGHASTPSNVLLALVSDPSSVVRRAVMARPEIPVDVLVDIVVNGESRLDAQIAAARHDFDVHANVDRLLDARGWGATAVLLRSDVPLALLHRYAMDDLAPAVRVRALRQGAPADVATRALLEAGEEDVRLAAIEGGQCTPESLAQAAGDASERVRIEVARNAATPAAAIDRLLVDPEEGVRRVAAASECASGAGLAQVVAKDPLVNVRRIAVANPRCPVDAIASACSNSTLVHAAVSNSACPPEGYFSALIALRDEPRQRQKGDNSRQARIDRTLGTVRTATRRLARRRWSWLQAQPLAELNPADLSVLLAKHLANAAGDDRPAVRMSVALHEDVSDDILLRLSSDPDESVRAAVTRRILGAAGGLS